jgi:chaperonin GroEL (HSP60 family)
MEIGLCYLFSWIGAQLAVQKFADAFDLIPLVLGENVGMNPIDIMTELQEKQKVCKSVYLQKAKLEY